MGDRAATGRSGNLGNESTGTLIALASARVARLAPFEPRKIVNQDEIACQDVLQSNEMIGHGSRGLKLKVQNSPCVERQKEARICIGMQDGIPDDE
ncbi:hypothetical protein [Bradyrhizobium commune]|uniref:Uncharacterized protein n=1 Tax=Bradyrhizobium commune TaxID=83627 RepID=A0A7S9D3A6_9BRAD|nr:hypothetical protein [Bradyrhizobium commune]QPF90351.1 hypothetical protein IC761_28210 [Bradyrhizobium commune]